MKICNHCKKTVGEKDVFCEHCGNMLGEEKESQEFIRMREDYPVINKRDKDVIALKEEKPKYGGARRLFKKVKGFFEAKKEQKEEEIVDVPELKEERKENKKFFMAEDETPKEDKKDDFILEGFEGVYTSKQIISKKTLQEYLKIGGGIILGAMILFILSFVFWKVFFPTDTGACPYECCINSTYEQKLCAGYASCISNQCVLEACPAEYECCSGVYYQAKACTDPSDICSDDFTCIDKPCPYECCTERDEYQPKICENDGNCINNKCYQLPCPYECCEDNVLYNDKSCGINKVCVNNECESRVVHDTGKVFGFIKNIIDFIL